MRLVVLGGGESGVGTAILGKKKGYEVFVSDYGEIKNNYKEVLILNQIPWEEKQHTEDLILNADVVMKSPGIPDKSNIVKQLKKNNVPIISEIEFASQFTDAVTVGGFIIDFLGRFPYEGECFNMEGIEFKIEKISKNTIMSVIIKNSFSHNGKLTDKG